MLNAKKIQLKKTIKHYTPELIVAVSLVAGGFAAKYILTEYKNHPVE